jgi:hypothetical protein
MTSTKHGRRIGDIFEVKEEYVTRVCERFD